MTETTDKPKHPRTHDDYLLSQGREHYEYARAATCLESCLYWLERYYDANNRHIQRIAKKQRMAQQQQKQLQKTLRNNTKKTKKEK